MPYTVVDDDTCLQIRASIEYGDLADLQNLIATLQNRADKIIQSAKENPDGRGNPIQSLPAGSTGTEPAGGDGDGARIA